MSPEYDKLFDNFIEKRSDIVIGRLDADTPPNTDISIRYGIYSFPVVVLFEPGSFHAKSVFQGERITRVMSKWVEINAPPVIKEIPVKKTNTTNLITADNIMEKVNKTEVTPEIEFIKNEVANLKSKLERAEKEIATLKNITKNKTESNSTDFKFEMPSTFNIIIICSSAMVFFALAVTLKRLFTKTLKDLEPHDKV
jgi:hypothetical protein